MCMARNWKGDVRKTDSLTDPIVGEIIFNYQQHLAFLNPGWETGGSYMRTYKAVYHIVDGKWRLHDILIESNSKNSWLRLEERLPAQYRYLKATMPDDF